MQFNGNTFLGLILARGGSKGIPGKNIKPLLGKPLIAYTIEAAKASGVFDRVALTTDDEAIANVARQYGCEVPFMRPAELAQDNTPGLHVLIHAAKWLREHGYAPDYIFALQPTSPLRQPFHIREAAELITRAGADSVISVREIPGHYNPMWALKLDEGNFVRLFVNSDSLRNRVPRRQELPKAHTTTGAVYLFKTHLLFDPTEPNLYGDRVAAYQMDDRYYSNIDVMADWGETAEKLKAIQNASPHA